MSVVASNEAFSKENKEVESPRQAGGLDACSFKENSFSEYIYFCSTCNL